MRRLFVALIPTLLLVSVTASGYSVRSACRAINDAKTCGKNGTGSCPINKKAGGLCGAGLSQCRSNECCNQYGICAKDADSCNALCQCQYSGAKSTCNGKLIPNKKLPVVDLASVCGPDIGRCPTGYCCSGYGFCTNDPAVCNAGQCSQVASGKGSQCNPNPAPKTHNLELKLTWGMRKIVNVTRPVILTNDQYPAPLIDVTEGDRLIITVHNYLQPNYPATISGNYYPLTEDDNPGETYPQDITIGDETENEVTIHWHGLVQRNTVIMDGVAEVTQQAIGYKQTQVYSFITDLPGPFWYHSHFKAQYVDGLRGPIIVRALNKGNTINEPPPVLVSDWYFDPAFPLLNWFLSPTSAGDEPVPDATLVGKYGQGSCTGLGCEYEVIKAVPSPIECTPETATNKLRFINGAGFARMYLTIDDHNMVIVALDAVDIKPSNYTPIFIFSPGQRISILVCPKDAKAKLKADAGGSFWIRPTIYPNAFPQEEYNHMAGNEARYTVLAVLDYGSEQSPTLKKLPTSTPWNISSPQVEAVLNTFTDDSYIDQPISGATPPEADVNITLTMTLNADVPIPENRPDLIKKYTGVTFAHFNNITFYRNPHAPSLLKKRLNGKLPPNANFGPHVINIKAGQVVQLIINNDDGGNHPLHLHGHWMWIMSRSAAGNDTDPNFFDPKTAVFDNTPLLRDTTEVRAMGNTVVRFVADNPGMWIFHCHIDWHLVGGLAFVLNYEKL